jgi:hypothetical protein
MFLRDIALFKKKLQTDVNILIGLQSNLIRRTANDIVSIPQNATVNHEAEIIQL